MYDVNALRARIPALASGTAFFDGPGGSQTPAEVAEAIASALTAPLSNRGTLTAAARNAEAIVRDARSAMADLLGAEPAGIVFGRSMTALTYGFARTLAAGWRAGDEVVVTRLDHDAHIRPWVQAAHGVGATVRVADFDPDSGELTPEHIAAVLGSHTRLVAVTAASNLIGTRPDVPAIAELAHAAGAVVSVDAVHLAAHAPVDRATLGADLLFCSSYKFLGPHLGVLAADPAWLTDLHPDKLLPSSDAVPERFELGTLPYESLAGVSACVEVLASLAGDSATDGDRRATLRAAMRAVERREEALLGELERGLAELGNVRIQARGRRHTPTLLLTFGDRDPGRVAAALADRDVNAPAGSFYALEASRHLGLGEAGGLRVGLAPYTSRGDVGRLLDGLAAALV